MTSPLALLGCYTTDRAPGLRSARLRVDGALEPLDALETESPSCVVWHPTLPIAYATNETLAGGVTAVAVDGDGKMRELGAATTGAAPCHAAVTADARWLLTADYVGGTVTLVALGPDGCPTATADALQLQGTGPHRERQDAAHPHMVAKDVAGEALLCVDLGTDRLTSLTISAAGRLQEGRAWQLPAGTGPRQVVAHPLGGTTSALVVGELSATLLHVRLGASGEAEVVAEVPTSASREATFPAQLTSTADGAYAIVSNRGPDTLSVFDLGTPSLDRVAEVAAGARWPRHFALTGDHLLVAGERSGTVASYGFGGSAVIGPSASTFSTPSPTWIAVR
ncbi:lactonase family protein [Mumia zhuanghuii]|uniref:lactonase family protein n=1 Tax=Mumia zhuanghuii TaxID=2585211 RepID=UPI0018915776|nr:beta-propeller fold lactonase family protein [Mumia zhuanghuii]